MSNIALHDFQVRFVEALREAVDCSFWRRRPSVAILDSGCDPTGRQLRAMAALTRGHVTGINPCAGFPTSEARGTAGERTTLLAMDGMALDFPDNSFDVVCSANVLEHVPDPARYLLECARVLKPGGIAWIEAAPVWSGPRGHHIHEDMVRENCPEETAYRNDGSVIPDWAHLTHSPAELEEILRPGLRPETVRFIVDYLASDDLNKVGWAVMRRAIESAFPWRRLHEGRCDTSPPAPLSGTCEDHRVGGFAALLRKHCPSGVSWAVKRRLVWRLRRCGL
jgi:SAM-dependent methyltransferase